jgi:hypothetical protein
MGHGEKVNKAKMLMMTIDDVRKKIIRGGTSLAEKRKRELEVAVLWGL